ncbi:hypothetical protein [Alkalihalobacillus pseudalcaliphilus]|uniref:hypothetical protein n=1 Tax=Alkalihalobacillus pseudalcaliphilus TaxID=79884 RepID=UPI00064DAD8C|nr:hypothetical protein [Alkalihalobacillus pseudalcaliphilus]KMK74399.1 hypothetical protein AB990_21030 [Alkalihalobacillus pseudalcaliphilus]
MKKWVVIVVLLISILLVGCSEKDDERLHVMAFSDEIYEKQQQLSKWIDSEDVRVTVFPTILERLIVELAGHQAHILIVHESITEPMDPEGLVPLEDFKAEPYVLRDESFVAGLALKEILSGIVELESEHLLAVPVYHERSKEAIAFIKEGLEEVE